MRNARLMPKHLRVKGKPRGPGRPFVKGQVANPKGRPKGSKNRATTDLREALKAIAEDNTELVEQCLHRVMKYDPGYGIELLLKLNEYVLPKLRSVEVSGPGGKPLESVQTIKREIVDAAVAPEKKDETP